MKAQRRTDTLTDWESETVALVGDGDRVVHHSHSRCIDVEDRQAGRRAQLEIWRVENGPHRRTLGRPREYKSAFRSSAPEPIRYLPQSEARVTQDMSQRAIRSSSPIARRATTTTCSRRYECGIVLLGAEVKSIRNGHANLQDGYARVDDGEVWLYGMHVSPYAFSHGVDLDPVRKRKLLLHHSEIDELARATASKGVTLVPLRVYFKDGRAKVELAVAGARRATTSATRSPSATRSVKPSARSRASAADATAPAQCWCTRCQWS